MTEIDVNKTIVFEVVGDIYPTLDRYLPFHTRASDYCTVRLEGTVIELSPYGKYLTYHGWQDNDGFTLSKLIISFLSSEQGLIKFHEVID